MSSSTSRRGFREKSRQLLKSYVDIVNDKIVIIANDLYLSFADRPLLTCSRRCDNSSHPDSGLRYDSEKEIEQKLGLTNKQKNKDISFNFIIKYFKYHIT